MSKTVSVLGLGIIGEIWARNLTADQFDLQTWNRTPKPDAPGFTHDIKQAIQGAEFIFCVVSDPAAVGNVLDALGAALGSGQTFIQSATISPNWSKTFAERVEARGARFLEAPFTGSKPAAEKRQTVFYCGGAPEVLEASRPVLEPLASQIFHFGPVGHASTIKLAMNMNVAMVAEALCESLAFARSQGITDDQYFEALSCNAGRAGLVDFKEAVLRERNYAPQFSVKHMNKDLRLGLETAGDFPLPMLRTLRRQYDMADAKGWGDEDMMALIKHLEP